LFKIISFIISAIFIFFTYSIYINEQSEVGSIGSAIADFSHYYIGYISYVYFLALIYPLYKINFTDKYYSGFDIFYNVIYGLFLFTILLIFQSLIVSDHLQGEIGFIIVSFLVPYIGISGIWIFVIISFILYIYDFILNNEKLFLYFHRKLDKSKQLLLTYKNNMNNKPKIIKKPKQVIIKEQKVKVTEIGDTAEITFEKSDEKLDNIEKSEKQIEPIVETTEDTIDEIVQEQEIQNIEDEIQDEQQPIHHTTIVNELEENKKLQEDLELGVVEAPKDFLLPRTDFFEKPPKVKKNKNHEAIIDQKIKDLLEKLRQFKIEGDVIRTYTGPIVTTFEFKPAPNVKVSKILNLQDDLAMALKATTIRIQAPIPGKDVVGIEVPNIDMETIYLREILESDLFQNSTSPLTMILGKDIVGQPFITDLKKLPHLLIAGTTGSGKSVGINSMILSLLYKNSPDKLKLIMIDPKMLEFSMYNDIPHLLTPVITKPMEAINALANMVREMEKRYAMMAETRTKNIENYNDKAIKNGYDEFPYVVIIIDELADLMMTSGKEVELSVARLAQMARASGIHLIVATQRPSVDVVTGLIKANLPSRVSYKVGQKIDSKIILDAMGAESLLGRGDMLFTPPGVSSLVRVHAPWSTEDEIDKVVDFLKEQREVQYDMSFVKEKSQNELSDVTIGLADLDELYEQAKLIVIQDQKSSISYLQRRLKIGYNRAASIVEQLEATKVLSEANIKGNREILI
jgi:S-DNA-T family DNA segregation ATPase FtsK/SpoIIIE